jgi:hypothetical protein
MLPKHINGCALLKCSLEVPTILTEFLGCFPPSLQLNAKLLPSFHIGHNRFLSLKVHFIIHELFYHSCCMVWATGSVVSFTIHKKLK